MITRIRERLAYYLFSPRLRRVRLVVLLAYSGGLFAALMLFKYHQGLLGWDFRAYYDASARLLAGTSLYTSDLLSGGAMVFAPGEYLYPPLLAQLVAPLSLLPFDAAFLLFTGASVILGSWSVLSAWRLGGGRMTARDALVLTGLLLFTVSLSEGLSLGNLYGPLMALVALAISGRPLLSGLLGGMLKIAPGGVSLLALTMSSERKQRSLAIAGGVLLLSMIASPNAWGAYIGGAFEQTLRTSDPIGAGANPAAIARLAGSVVDVRRGETGYVGAAEEAYRRSVMIMAPPWVSAVPTGLLVALASAEGALRVAGWVLALWLIILAIRAAKDPRQRHVAVALMTGGSLLIPWALWDHYLLLLVPPAIVAWRVGARPARLRLLCGLIVTIIPVAAAMGRYNLAVLIALLLLLDGIRRTRLPESGAKTAAIAEGPLT